MSRLYQLAEWFGLCDLIAERDIQYKQPKRVLSIFVQLCPKKMQKNVILKKFGVKSLKSSE